MEEVIGIEAISFGLHKINSTNSLPNTECFTCSSNQITHQLMIETTENILHLPIKQESLTWKAHSYIYKIRSCQNCATKLEKLDQLIKKSGGIINKEIINNAKNS